MAFQKYHIISVSSSDISVIWLISSPFLEFVILPTEKYVHIVARQRSGNFPARF